MTTATVEALPHFREVVRRNLAPVVAVIDSLHEPFDVIENLDLGGAISALAMQAKREIEKVDSGTEGFEDSAHLAASALCTAIALAAIWGGDRDEIVPLNYPGPGPDNEDACIALGGLAEFAREMFLKGKAA